MADKNNLLLEIRGLGVQYAGIRALENVSLDVLAGEIVAVVGANGAGKSTLLKTLSGLKTPSSGEIRFDGEALPRHAYQIVRKGIALVPEGRRIFYSLTVVENLRLGAYTSSDREAVKQSLESVYNLFPILRERERQPGGTLSGGEQQMLAIGRALMSRPRLLLLDEPSLGLAPLVIDTLFERIIDLNRSGLTILLVEQNAALALETSSRAYVLESGRIRMEGSGRSLLSDDRIRASFLGVKTS